MTMHKVHAVYARSGRVLEMIHRIPPTDACAHLTSAHDAVGHLSGLAIVSSDSAPGAFPPLWVSPHRQLRCRWRRVLPFVYVCGESCLLETKVKSCKQVMMATSVACWDFLGTT